MSTTLAGERLAPPPLTSAEAEMAKTAERMIMAALDHSRAATITISTDDGSEPHIAVPPGALRLLAQVLGLMARKQPLTLMPDTQELSTVEAANFLNVSRPFLIKEIEKGKLPHRMVGTHRRVLFCDVIEYSKQTRKQQQAALDKMADNARELGLEY